VALAELQGPDKGLAMLNEIGSDLNGYHFFHASRGAMLERLGRREEASRAYAHAAGLAKTPSDIQFLRRQAATTSRTS